MAKAEHDRPGEPPEVRDEAADTPLWVPALGLAVLLFGAVFLVWNASMDEQSATTEAQQAEPAEVEAEDTPGMERAPSEAADADRANAGSPD